MDSPSKNPSSGDSAERNAVDGIISGAGYLASSAAEKLQAVKDIWKTFSSANETFQKGIESNTAAMKAHFEALAAAMSRAESPDERERYAKMSEQAARDAYEATDKVNGRTFELAAGTVLVLGAIAAGTAAVLLTSRK